MRKRLIVALLGLSFLGGPALAEVPSKCARGFTPDEITCGDREASPASPRDRTTGTTVPLVQRTFLRTLPDGTECRYLAWVPGGERGSLVDHPEYLAPIFAPPCPEADPVEASVREFWQTVVLPRPEPHIAPGRAIAGKRAYLEIGGARTQTFTVPNPLGGPAIVVEATATYTVAWGDGTTTKTTSQGGPWPDGDVTHVWTTAGRYDVVVTEEWTATWRAGPVQGALDGLRTVGRIDDFPVQEVQAVRNR